MGKTAQYHHHSNRSPYQQMPKPSTPGKTAMTRSRTASFFGGRRRVTDHKLTVSPSAVQWAEGTVDDGRIEGPHIYVYDLDENPLNCGQARELAAALLASVAEVDRWAQR
jgi:hypothetical protein